MEKTNIYFVGAGGIGMAALERYFLSRGCRIAGYDRTPTALTDALQAEGVEISFSDDPATIPSAFTDPASTLVVYTPAVGNSNLILNHFRNGGFEIIKRAALLGKITKDTHSICVAGTHGKTTVSSMAAHILTVARCAGCNAFLGGVLRNYGTNFLLNPSSDFSVAEADEYDRSFHWLHPDIAVVTATDPDHLDIYGTEEAYLESFSHFTSLIKENGILIMHTGLKFVPRTKPSVRTYTYSRSDTEADFHARDIRSGNGTITFTLVTPQGEIPGIELGVPVDINIENAIAASAAALLTGRVTHDELRTALRTFQGAERRFQFHIKEQIPGGHVVIDDYAHHPDEVRAAILSVKALYPGARLTVAFQPHLYSRTRDFAPEFARALSLADETILIDIYPARELPIPGITSAIINNRLTNKKEIAPIPLEMLPDTIKNRNFEILLTLGAGDINTMLPQILENLRQCSDRQ